MFRGDHEMSNDYDDGHVRKADEELKVIIVLFSNR